MSSQAKNPAHSIRLQARSNTLQTPTSGLAPGYLQANLLILPSRYSQDFLKLCTSNPIPCPLLAYSTSPGSFSSFKSLIPDIPDEKIAHDLDIRTDVPRYNIYSNGILQKSREPHIRDLWDENDHVAFLIGCSYSFESSLSNSGLQPPHVKFRRNVSMYRSNLPLSLPAGGVFAEATMVVSMRFYRAREIEKVRVITREFGITHGEPVAWGWDGAERIGVRDLDLPEWGDEPVSGEGGTVIRTEEEGKGEEGYVPVFWGCGVTPQEAVMRAGDAIEGVVVGHEPGFMVLLDVRDEEILGLGG